jgi:hypothetical protein
MRALPATLALVICACAQHPTKHDPQQAAAALCAFAKRVSGTTGAYNTDALRPEFVTDPGLKKSGLLMQRDAGERLYLPDNQADVDPVLRDCRRLGL